MDSLQKAFMKVFEKFEIKPNEMLLINSFHQFRNSLQDEDRNNLPLKIEELQSEGYINIKDKNGIIKYFLTQKGADFLYSE
jgi:hypothetical protein